MHTLNTTKGKCTHASYQAQNKLNAHTKTNWAHARTETKKQLHARTRTKFNCTHEPTPTARVHQMMCTKVNCTHTKTKTDCTHTRKQNLDQQKNSNNTFLPGQKPNQLVNKSLTDASTKRKELANNDQTKAESTHKQNLDQHKKSQQCNQATNQPTDQPKNK